MSVELPKLIPCPVTTIGPPSIISSRREIGKHFIVADVSSYGRVRYLANQDLHKYFWERDGSEISIFEQIKRGLISRDYVFREDLQIVPKNAAPPSEFIPSLMHGKKEVVIDGSRYITPGGINFFQKGSGYGYCIKPYAEEIVIVQPESLSRHDSVEAKEHACDYRNFLKDLEDVLQSI